MFVETTVEAAQIASDIFQNRRKLVELSRKIWQFITEGKLNLLVFGPSGVGKSTFGRVLAGEFNVDAHSRYVDSIDKETYKLPGGVLCDILIPPGQRERREYHWPDLYEMIRDGASTGVVNVGAYGYHSMMEDAFEQVDVYQEGMSRADFLEVYLETRRENELDILKQLKPRLIDAPGKLWMLTVVSKQDLWWADRQEVQDWYVDGPYGTVVREIEEERGPKYFQHEVASACFIIQVFVDGRGAVLATTTQGYDEPLKEVNLRRFKSRVCKLAGV